MNSTELRDIIAIAVSFSERDDGRLTNGDLQTADAVLAAIAASGRVIGTPLFGSPIETDELGANVALVRVEEVT